MTHVHDFRLAGRPEPPRRGRRSGGQPKGWSVRYRCSICRATKRGAVRAEFMEMKSAVASCAGAVKG